MNISEAVKRSSISRGLAIVTINLAVLCTLVMAVELGAQLVYFFVYDRFPVEEVTATSYHQEAFELHPFLVGRLKSEVVLQEGDKVISTTSRHTRWTGAPPDDRSLKRIATLGGSTTFGIGVTDEDTWPALLQSRLGRGFSVANFGAPGYSTAEAVIQMALLVPEIKPEFVVIYQGWNDLKNYHDDNLGPDYYSHGMNQFRTLDLPTPYQRTPIDVYAGVFATVRLAKSLGQAYFATNRPLPKPHSTPDPFVDRVYVRNLRTLMTLADAISAYTILVPQVLNVEEYAQRSGANYWSPRVKNSAMPELMKRFNGLMASVCAPATPDCVFASEIDHVDWQAADFIDLGHFSRQGGDKFAKVVGDLILEREER